MAIIERLNVAANPRGEQSPTQGWGGTGSAFLGERGYAGPGGRISPVKTIRNFVPNPSFEAPDPATSWVFSNATAVRTTSFHEQMWPDYGYGSGPFLLQMTATGNGNYITLTQRSTSAVDVVPGQWIGVSVLVAGDTLGGAAGSGFRSDVVTTNGTTSSYHASGAFEPAGWYTGRRIIYAIQVPADRTQAYVRVQGYSGSGTDIASGQRMWVDDVMAVVAETEADALAAVSRYLDGDTEAPDVAWASWDGTEKDSASTIDVYPDAVVNWAANPSFETGLDNIVFSSSAFTLYHNTSPDFSRVGTSSCRATVTTADNYAFIGSSAAPVKPGEWVGGSMWVRTSGGVYPFAARTIFYDLDGAQVGSGGWGAVTTPPDATWTEVRVATSQAPSGAVSAQTYLYQGNATAGSATLGAVFFTDTWLVVKAATEAAANALLDAGYFDGDTGRTGDTEEAFWDSVRGGSPSLRTSTLFPPPAEYDVGFAWAGNNLGPLGYPYARHGSAINFSLTEPGVRYGASVWMANLGGTPALVQRFRGSWRDANRAPLPGVPDFDIALEGSPEEGWTFYSGSTPVAPEGAVYLSIFPWWYGPGETVEWGGLLAWAQMMLEPGVAPPGPYFDGGFEDTLDAWYYTDAQGISHAVINTRPGKGAWGIELGGISLEGGDGIVPTLLSVSALDGIVGCLTEPPDGLGLPPRRVQDVVLAQRDGVAMLADFYENRIITIKATVSGGAGCDGCPTAKQNVRKLLRTWARYCGGESALRIFTDCHGQGDVADVGPFWAIGRGRAAEVVWRPGGVQVADVTLRFDCVDHLLRFNPDPEAGMQEGYLQSVDIPVLDSFWVNYFSDPRGVTLDPLVWDYDLGLGEAITLTTVEDATDGWLLNDDFPGGGGRGGMEADGAGGGAFGEHATTYARVTVTDAPDAGPAGGVMNMNSELPTVAGTVVTARFYVRSSEALPYTSRIYGGSSSAQIAAGTLTPDEWTLISGTYTATASGTATVTFDVETASNFPPIGTTIDFGGVVIQEGDSPNVFFDGTPSFIPLDYNQPGGFGWVTTVENGPPVAVNRYASRWEAGANGSPTIVGLGPQVQVPATGDTCVKMEVQFSGPLTGPIYLVDVANNRWVGYALDIEAGETAVLDTNTGRMSHNFAGSASGDTSYALSGDTFMALDPQSGLTAEFELWTGDMNNDTGYVRIYWADAVLGV